MRAQEFIFEAEPKVLPIIPDNMPFGANQFKDPTGTFKGGGMSTPPPAAKQTTAPASTPSAASSVPSTFKNVVVPPKFEPPPPPGKVNLGGRNPSKPEDVTHAYRLMSPGELQHAQANGAFLPNPNADRANGWNTNHKYWSSGDAQGQFGRPWGGDARVSVRVPIDKVPGDSPVNAGHAEVFNTKTGAWTPVIAPEIKEQR